MKCPCDQHCTERKLRCRETCERYAEYREWQEAKREADYKAFIVRDYQVTSTLRVKKLRRIKT